MFPYEKQALIEWKPSGLIKKQSVLYLLKEVIFDLRLQCSFYFLSNLQDHAIIPRNSFLDLFQFYTSETSREDQKWSTALEHLAQYMKPSIGSSEKEKEKKRVGGKEGGRRKEKGGEESQPVH